MWEFDIEEYKEDLGQICNEKVDINSKSYKQVCHYTSPFGLEGILKSMSIRFTEFSVLNDGSEGEMIYDCIEFCLEKLKNKLSREFYEAVAGAILSDKNYFKWTKYIEPTTYNYFVACFCEKKDSLPMWNYYTKTKDSLGYSIVFDFKTIFDNLILNKYDFLDMACFKVNYNYVSQSDIISKFLSRTNEYWMNTKSLKYKGQLINEFNNFIEYLKLCFKNDGFVSEDEVRFVIRIENEIFKEKIKFDNGKEMIKLQYSNGIYKPYIDLEFGEPNAIKEIVVSPTIRDNASKNSVEFLLEKYDVEADVTVSRIPLMY